MKQPTTTILLVALASLSSCSKDKKEEEPSIAVSGESLVEMAAEMAETDKSEEPEVDPACPGVTKITAMRYEDSGQDPLAPLPAQFTFAKADLNSRGLAIYISTQDWSIKELPDMDVKSKDEAIFTIFSGGKEFAKGSDVLATSYEQLRAVVQTNGFAVGIGLTETSHLKILAKSKDLLCGEFAFEMDSDSGKGKFVGEFIAPLTENGW